MFDFLAAFQRCRNGNFSQMLVVAIIPLLGAAGYAMDFAEASRIRSLLRNAADAAAVGAVSEASPSYRLIGDKSWTEADAREDALNIFNAYVIGQRGYTIDALDAEFTRDGTEMHSTITFKATIPARFMRVLGRESTEVSGQATASVRTSTFMDFYLLLDNTPSMGVGATPTDIDTLVANTSDQCAFACHETENANNYYNLAKKLGVAMRIDVVRQATQSLFERAETVRDHHNQFRMAAYTFGDAATSLGLKEVVTLTADMKKAQKDAGAIDLMTIPRQGYDNDQQTNFDATFASLDKEIDTPGLGSDEKNRQKIVFFVSDGVGDSYKPGTCTKKTLEGRCQEPIDVAAACSSLKARGVKIAVLYTTYLPLPTNGWYNTWVAPFQAEINPRMKECATPGLFFEVSPTEGISDAMNTLFLKVVANPRITS